MVVCRGPPYLRSPSSRRYARAPVPGPSSPLRAHLASPLRSRSHPARAIPALLNRPSPYDFPVLAPLRPYPVIPRSCAAPPRRISARVARTASCAFCSLPSPRRPRRCPHRAPGTAFLPPHTCRPPPTSLLLPFIRPPTSYTCAPSAGPPTACLHFLYPSACWPPSSARPLAGLLPLPARQPRRGWPHTLSERQGRPPARPLRADAPSLRNRFRPPSLPARREWPHALPEQQGQSPARPPHVSHPPCATPSLRCRSLPARPSPASHPLRGPEMASRPP